jgi:predicted transcriptional regulator
MTPRQQEIYTYILTFKAENRYVPNNMQIAKQFGTTHQSVQQIIGQLIKKGYLEPRKQARAGAYVISELCTAPTCTK